MKNKNGFTLIELLAVIVILAIVALISVPIILNIIENAKKGALKDSAYGIIDAAELYYAKELTKVNTDTISFTITGGKFVLDSDGTTELSFKGEMPRLGNVGVDGRKTFIRITDGSYCAYKSIDDLDVNVIKGNCTDISSTGFASGNSVSGGGNPTGTIISYYGNDAPIGYLKCDGSEYDINDYPDLAALILATTGSYGTEASGKFKVPDLRGEFLRGTGTNGHSGNGNGASVGTHQDATSHLIIDWNNNEDNIVIYNVSSLNGTVGPIAADSSNVKYTSLTGKGKRFAKSSEWQGDVSNHNTYTSRPTNTSVLYCIKY